MLVPLPVDAILYCYIADCCNAPNKDSGSYDAILYCYIADGTVKAVDRNQQEFNFSQSLDELTEMLDPKRFFRANRQFLIAKDAIKDVRLWFNGRLTVNLKVPVPEKIIISKAKVPEFKEWF